MRKTIIALMALAGVASATDTPTAVWSLENVPLGGYTEYTQDKNGVTLSGLNMTGNAGYTAMITMNWTATSNAPVFWLATTEGAAYANSTATFGYKALINHAALFSTTGSNSACTNEYVVTNDNRANVPDYIGGAIGNSAMDTSLASASLTYFLTSESGTARLYELLNDGSVTLIATQTGMKTGTLGTLAVGHWSGQDAHQSGTMSIQLYDSVLSSTQMQALVPEPATASLSLLALAGLAARRRRK